MQKRGIARHSATAKSTFWCRGPTIRAISRRAVRAASATATMTGKTAPQESGATSGHCSEHYKPGQRRSGYTGTGVGESRNFESCWRNPGWQDLPRKESDERFV